MIIEIDLTWLQQYVEYVKTNHDSIAIWYVIISYVLVILHNSAFMVGTVNNKALNQNEKSEELVTVFFITLFSPLVPLFGVGFCILYILYRILWVVGSFLNIFLRYGK